VKSFFKFFRSRFLPLGDCSCFQQNQTSICCLSHEGPPQKIELVISCLPRNKSTGASGACTPSPSRVMARPGRPQAEESRVVFSRQQFTLPLGFPSLLEESLVGGDRSPLNRPPACAPPRESDDSRFLSVSPGRLASSIPDSGGGPYGPFRPEPIADACCAAWRSACAYCGLPNYPRLLPSRMREVAIAVGCRRCSSASGQRGI
jgi:hypothetical protein